jgi:hypothetical protein
MGEPKGNVEEGLEFEVVQEVFDPASHSKRNLAAYEVKRTGASASNVEAAEIFVKWVQKHYGDTIDPLRCFLLFGANPKKGLVALYVSETATEGSTAIRWADDRKTFSFHLGAVLRKYPQLQPSTTVEALFTEMTDKDGRPCLAIKVKGALPKRKGPVDSAVAAQKKAEREERKRKRTEKKTGSSAGAAAESVAAGDQGEKGN